MLWALVVVIGLVIAIQADPTPDIVRVNGGLLKGVLHSEHTRVFKGVPYAEPPVGDLRWRPPVPKAPWAGKERKHLNNEADVWDATDFRWSCLQGPFDPPITNKSEDCLYLNVYAPVNPPPASELYPVMLWIHGGGYTGGGGNESRLNGTWGVEHFQNVIIVTINYRLNIFGFLGGKAMADRSPDGSFGNYGLQDQRAAMQVGVRWMNVTLQWVHDNIHAFYGDKNQLTIYGESAGAGSVANHLAAPRSWPLFSKAIMESGGFGLWNAQDAVSAEDTLNASMAALHCDTIACMVQADAQALLQFSFSASPRFDYSRICLPNRCKTQIAWAPTVDGVELTAHPWMLAQEGKAAKVPVIIGTNTDEGSYFINLPTNASQAQFEQWLNQQYGPLAPLVRAVYPPQAYPPTSFASSYWYMAEHIWGDFSMTCPARRAARWLSRAQPDVFLYMFTHAPTGSPVVFHAAEIPFVYMAFNLIFSDADHRTSMNIATLWNTFALHGSPTIDDAWPRYTNNTDINLFIDVELVTGTRLRNGPCDFWDAQLSSRCITTS